MICMGLCGGTVGVIEGARLRRAPGFFPWARDPGIFDLYSLGEHVAFKMTWPDGMRG